MESKRGLLPDILVWILHCLRARDGERRTGVLPEDITFLRFPTGFLLQHHRRQQDSDQEGSKAMEMWRGRPLPNHIISGLLLNLPAKFLQHQHQGGDRMGSKEVESRRVSLPDDILSEILLRLPARSISRFRCAGKLFSALTSDPSFMNSHARRATPALLIQVVRSTPAHLIEDFHTQDLEMFEHTDLYVIHKNGTCDGVGPRVTQMRVPNPHKNNTFTLLSSCDGLLCFREGLGLQGRYHVRNPLTRDWISIPRSEHLSWRYLQVLYFHPSTREYRLLWRSIRMTQDHLYIFEVLTLGTSTFRRIKSSPYGPPHPTRTCFVSLHGNLHCCGPKYDDTNCKFDYEDSSIVVFSMDSEEFSQMPHPGSRVWFKNHLIQTDGCLGLCEVTSQRNMKVWILRDYTRKVWHPQYTICIPENMGPPAGVKMESLRPLTPPDEEGDLLLGWGNRSGWGNSSNLICWLDYGLVIYNFKLNTLRKLEVGGVISSSNIDTLYDVPYVESLVSASLWKRLRGLCEDGSAGTICRILTSFSRSLRKRVN